MQMAAMFTHFLSIGPSDADQRDGQWTPDGRHFVFVSYRDGFSSTYELVSPPWFEFWKKASAVRLTPEQMDIVAMTPTRDSANLLVIGRSRAGIDARLTILKSNVSSLS